MARNRSTTNKAVGRINALGIDMAIDFGFETRENPQEVYINICRCLESMDFASARSVLTEYFSELCVPTRCGNDLQRILAAQLMLLDGAKSKKLRAKRRSRITDTVDAYIEAMDFYIETGAGSKFASKRGAEKLEEKTWRMHVKIHKLANALLEKNPRLSKVGIARILISKHNIQLAESTIRNKLAIKPVRPRHTFPDLGDEE